MVKRGGGSLFIMRMCEIATKYYILCWDLDPFFEFSDPNTDSDPTFKKIGSKIRIRIHSSKKDGFYGFRILSGSGFKALHAPIPLPTYFERILIFLSALYGAFLKSPLN